MGPSDKNQKRVSIALSRLYEPKRIRKTVIEKTHIPSGIMKTKNFVEKRNHVRPVLKPKYLQGCEWRTLTFGEKNTGKNCNTRCNFEYELTCLFHVQIKSHFPRFFSLCHWQVLWSLVPRYVSRSRKNPRR